MVTDKKPIVVVGSINMDMVAFAKCIPAPGETVGGTDFQLHPGGKGANQAVAVGRLGYPVHMIGRVGSDSFGPQLRASLRDAGVNVDCVMTTDGPSGVASIVVAEDGQNCIVVVPGANARLTAQDLDRHIDVIRSAGLVLTQLETPIKTVGYLAAICHRAGVPLMLDPAPAQELPKDLLRLVTWLTPNETEASFFVANDDPALVGAAPNGLAKLLLEKGPAGVVLKLGSRGSYLMSTDGLSELIPPFVVNAVDTVAAGDCFNGAFASGLMMGMRPPEAAHFASAAAAICVTRVGAQPSMPRLDEVEQLRKLVQS